MCIEGPLASVSTLYVHGKDYVQIILTANTILA